MQNPHSPSPQPSTPFFSASTFKDPKTTLSIIVATSLIFFLTLSSSSFASYSSSSQRSRPDPFLFPTRQTHHIIFQGNNPLDPPPPSIAYLISGSSGDSVRILRLLFAVYHPRNQYLLHLDRSASQTDREGLALKVQSVPIFKAAQNVNVLGKADFVYPKGSSSISFTLHGASVLLRLSNNWDWFISLNAGDYPLVTQDGMVNSLSSRKGKNNKEFLYKLWFLIRFLMMLLEFFFSPWVFQIFFIFCHTCPKISILRIIQATLAGESMML